MSLRYAILAVLRVAPLSGYDLQKVFAESVGHVWHAPDSQIYPELRRMTADGVVVGEEQTRGERGRRRVYHVTDAGEQEFRAWMAEPVPYSRTRDPAYLRAAYLESANAADAEAFFVRHGEHHRELEALWAAELERIRSRTHPILERRLEVVPERERARAAAFKEFVYEGLVDGARREAEWAQRGLRLLAVLDGDDNRFVETSEDSRGE